MNPPTLRALIVDDEPLGRERVSGFLEESADVEIAGQCGSGESALEAIRSGGLDVVFLDIQMPDLDGFGVIRALEEAGDTLPAIVFVTAYDAHAVRAFEVHAIDYLLKPIDRARLKTALERVRSHLGNGTQDALRDQIRALLAEAAAPENPDSHPQRIEIRSQGRWDYIPIEDIYWIKADGNYLEIHTADTEHLHRETMAKMESQLDPERFLRVGRSTIVCLARVRSVTTLGRNDHYAVMENDAQVPITRNLKELQNRLRFAG